MHSGNYKSFISRMLCLLITVAVASSVLSVLPAHATIIGPDVLITALDAADNSASYQTEGEWSGEQYVWSLEESFDFYDNDVYLGSLQPGSGFSYMEDPVVILNASATAGSVTTTFLLQSAIVSFPTLTNPIGTADINFTLTDNNSNGATLSGTLGASSNALYVPQYNGNSPFAELLLGSTTIGSGFVDVSASESPTTISGNVYDMRSALGFTLTAGDSVNLSSTYTIRSQQPIPEPATMLLFGVGLAGLAGYRRRKAKKK